MRRMHPDAEALCYSVLFPQWFRIDSSGRTACIVGRRNSSLSLLDYLRYRDCTDGHFRRLSDGSEESMLSSTPGFFGKQPPFLGSPLSVPAPFYPSVRFSRVSSRTSVRNDNQKRSRTSLKRRSCPAASLLYTVSSGQLTNCLSWSREVVTREWKKWRHSLSRETPRRCSQRCLKAVKATTRRHHSQHTFFVSLYKL